MGYHGLNKYIFIYLWFEIFMHSRVASSCLLIYTHNTWCISSYHCLFFPYSRHMYSTLWHLLGSDTTPESSITPAISLVYLFIPTKAKHAVPFLMQNKEYYKNKVYTQFALLLFFLFLLFLLLVRCFCSLQYQYHVWTSQCLMISGDDIINSVWPPLTSQACVKSDDVCEWVYMCIYFSKGIKVFD